MKKHLPVTRGKRLMAKPMPSLLFSLVMLLFFNTKVYGQAAQPGHQFFDYGSSTNAHNTEGTIAIEPSTNRNAGATEGQIDCIWLANIRWNNGGCAGNNTVYNKVGVWSTTANIYYPNSTSVATGITNEIGYFNSNHNIYDRTSNNDFVASLGDIGPSKSYSIQILHNYGENGSGCDKDRDFRTFNGTTAKLKAITNLQVINQVFPRITWQKGTNYMDNFVAYEIRRKKGSGAYQTIATISGDKRTYVDASLTLDGDYTYSVKTILSTNAPGDWNRDISATEAAVEVNFTFTKLDVVASTDQSGRIKLSWPSFNNIKGIDGMMLYKDSEELIDLSKTTKNYNDSEVIPGLYYKYTLALIQDDDESTPEVDQAWRTDIAEGKSLPNGKISGYIKGRTNAGVPGVVVTVSSKTPLSDGKITQVVTHTATTGADGYYEIPGIFYANKADFNIVPQMPGYTAKRFDPEILARTLSVDDANKQNVDFTDTASFAVSGKVYFASLKDSLDRDIFLPLQDAEIWLDGKNSSFKTKADGSYSIGITSPGNHSIQIKFKNHLIDFDDALNPNLQTDTVKSVLVNKLIADFNFMDRATDTLTIKVAASCDAPIGEYVILKLSSDKAGFATGNVTAKYNKKLYVSSYDWDKGAPKNPGQEKMGQIKMVLPATGFEGQVTEVRENEGINSNKLEYFTKTYNLLKVNLAHRDTTKNVTTNTTIKTIKADTTYKPDKTIDKITPSRKDTVITNDTTYVVNAPKMEFIYRDKLQLLINNGNPAFADSVRIKPTLAYKYLLSQNDKHLLNVKIAESYAYRGVNYTCVLDTGNVYIYDGISDVVDRQDFRLDSLTHDVKYRLKIGAPVLEAPYQKTIQIVGKVGSRQTNQIISAVVEGERARNATFVTKTPEIPFFVLHDPPGDNSYATISKGTTISGSHTTQYAGGAGAGAYTDVRFGTGAALPVIGTIGAGLRLQGEIEAGADKNSGTTTNNSMTFTEDFSTSSDETLVGANGDVYVGASMNMIYALTDVLKYDATKQDMVRDTSLAIQENGFNTTFLYTEYHIKNILLKQLNTLYSIAKGKYDEAAQKRNNGDQSVSITALDALHQSQSEYKAGIDAWQKALEKNDEARKKAPSIKLPANTKGVVGDNISLSAGAVYDNSISFQNDTTTSTEVSVYLNGFVRASAVASMGAHNEKEVGGLVTFRFNYTKSKDTTTTRTVTTNYHLEDNDLGDFMSIALGEDKTNANYSTPVFKIVSGSTSCPREENTQYRHLPAIQVAGANEQRNVPSDKAAKFEILIANRSESDETVEYAVKLDPASNPDGARVLVGGQDVTNGQATYYIPAGKNFKLPVEVFRGPLTSVYENLSLVIFSTCDNTLGDIDESVLSKPTVKLNAYFQNKCSEIDLFVPGNNWLVNQSNGNKLFVAFSKYDASAASPLTTVGLQYRKINQDYENSLWSTVATFPKSALIDKYYDYTFDVSTLPDGKYEIRAIAVCQGVDVNYSPVYSGVIDRVSAVAFGLPTPANGILTNSDVVGVTFNKDIVYTDNVNPVKVILKRKDNGQLIPATVTGDGRKFIVKTMPESLINDYENVELTATIQNLVDVNGNKVADSVSWSFVVNLSPVYWKPANVTISAIENVQSNFSAKLMNKSALPQNFTLIKYPAWLTPSYKTGKLVAQGEQNIDFTIDKNLNTGTYADTVVAMADNKRQLLYVTVNVLRTPPNWTVNPANFKFNMNLTTQFSLNSTDTLTSIDVRDKVGVFVGDECRGVANIEYDRNTQKYVAYITAYSNNETNESLTFHFWDTYPGIEYQGLERVNFVSNGIVGNADNPYVLHPEGVYQTIPLKKGWSWISLNVTNTDMSVKKVLAKLKPTEGDVIKASSNNYSYSQFDKNLGWGGTIDSINVYNSYMIYVAKPDTIRVLGQFIAQKVNVKLNKGWNWTGYPMAINMELSNYLKNYKPADGSQIISQDEFAQYNATSNTWSGSLKYLRPGKGYRFNSLGDNFEMPVVTYVPEVSLNPKVEIPENDSELPIVVNNRNHVANSSVDGNMSVNTTNYQNNMSMTSAISQGGQIVNDTADRYEIRVYVDDKLVNIVNQTTLPNGRAIGFIPIISNAADENKLVTIKVYDKIEKREYNAKIENAALPNGQNVSILPIKNNIIKEGVSRLVMAHNNQENDGQTDMQNTSFSDDQGDLSAPDIQNTKAEGNFVIVHDNEEEYFTKIINAISQKTDQIIGTIAKPVVLVLEGDANIKVANSVSLSRVNIGQEFSYQLKVENIGPDLATNFVLTDQLPEGFDFVSSTDDIVYNSSTRTLTVSRQNFSSAAVQIYTIKLKGGKVQSTNLGSGAVTINNDTDLSNNNFNKIALEVVDRRANATVQISSNKASLNKSEELEYAIKIINNGPELAKNITLQDILPNNMQFVSATNGIVYNAADNTLTATIKDLPTGSDVSFKINLLAKAAGDAIFGNGKIEGENDNDIDFNNNKIEPITVKVIDNNVDVKVSNAVSLNKVNIGQEFTYELKVENLSADEALNFTLKDQLPDGFDYISSTDDLIYNSTTRTFSVARQKLAGKAQITYAVKLKPNKVFTTTLGNGGATVNNEIDLGNNNFSKITIEVVDRRADVTVRVNVSKNPVNKNDNLEYSITLVNNGPVEARNITLQDVLPTAFKFVSATNGLTYTANGNELKASLANLAAGNTYTYKITLIALNVGNQSLGNGKVDAENDNNIDFNNNQISPVAVRIVENSVDLLVTNSLEKNVVDKGELFNYAIRVKNNGPDNAQYLKLSDALPSGFDFISSASPQLSFDANNRILLANIDELRNGNELEFTITLKANTYGNLSLGNGSVAVNNETNAANNQILPVSIIVADKRTNDTRIIVPTLFTPNGDGINDVFEIPGLNEFYVSNTLVIFNKNYNIVYNKQNYKNDWDGGQLPMGSYGYILKTIDKSGKEFIFKGSITIIYQ